MPDLALQGVRDMILEGQPQLTATESKADNHTRLTSVMGQIKHRTDKREEAAKGKLDALRKEVQHYEAQPTDLERDIAKLEEDSRALPEEMPNTPPTLAPETEERESLGERPAGDACLVPARGWRRATARGGSTTVQLEEVFRQLVAGLSVHLAGDAEWKRPRADPVEDTGELSLWTGAARVRSRSRGLANGARAARPSQKSPDTVSVVGDSQALGLLPWPRQSEMVCDPLRASMSVAPLWTQCVRCSEPPALSSVARAGGEPRQPCSEFHPPIQTDTSGRGWLRRAVEWARLCRESLPFARRTDRVMQACHAPHVLCVCSCLFAILRVLVILVV